MASALVGAWPDTADLTILTPGMPEDVRRRVVPVGAISRFGPQPNRRRRPGPRRAAVLQGRGGDALTLLDAEELGRLVPGWDWVVLGGAAPWSDDLGTHLTDADVVVTTAGQGSLADVAAHRRPAVVIPADRPHEEQLWTAEELAAGPWPAVVVPTPAKALTMGVLSRAAALPGQTWDDWYDGRGAGRLCREIAAVARPPRAPVPG
jgi:predicted glycosyltransferase